MDEKEMLLGVWGLGAMQFDVPLPRSAASCHVFYPVKDAVSVRAEGKTLHLRFERNTAAVLQIVFADF